MQRVRGVSRVCGEISLSRALGDIKYKLAGVVSAEADTRTATLATYGSVRSRRVCGMDAVSMPVSHFFAARRHATKRARREPAHHCGG